VWFEPGAAVFPGPLTEAATATFVVDPAGEEVRVTNIGVPSLELGGWRILSVRGNQDFTFPEMTLAGGASVTVVSGPGRTEAPPAVLLWSTTRVWNDDGDPGQLFDVNNQLVAEFP
jgi:hypothetical protein